MTGFGAQQKPRFLVPVFRSCPRPWKNASYDIGEARCFLAVTAETPWFYRRLRLERGDQVLIAAISGATPRIVIIRLMLYARTRRLISVRTLSRVRVRKWVAPIQDLRVPNGCSTVSSHAHGVGHAVEPILHGVKHAFVFPALDPLHFLRGAPQLERTGVASGQMTVVIDVARAVGSDPPPGQVLTGRASVVILLGVVDEILPGE